MNQISAKISRNDLREGGGSLGEICTYTLLLTRDHIPFSPEQVPPRSKPQIINATSVLHDTTQSITMASLSHTSRAILRAVPRRANPAAPSIRALSTSSKKSDSTSSFESPFRGMGNEKSSKIPDFGNYRSKSGTNTNLVFQYFMVGTMGALTAAGAKATVQGEFGRGSGDS